MWVILYQNPEVWPSFMTYDKGAFCKITEANFSKG
jgi:antitoxin component YwqK of YwqJK toxin-antitoxin module